MAAKREIKTTLKLEGEQEYRRQMTDAAGAIKTLNSEQKLAEAQFKRTGDEQEYAASKAEILRKKIEEQKKAVAAAEAAVKELTANGVKPNDKAMQTWQTKLNNAKTGLVNMQTELDNTEKELGQQETALKDTSTETGNLQTAMDSLDRQVTLENVAKAIDTVYDSLMGVVRGVARAAKALWDWETEGADWADELLTTATQTGMDVETLQAWRYAAQFIDTEVEDIIKARDKLTKGMVKATPQIEEAYDSLGVSAFDAAGRMRDSEDVFWDVLAALAEITDETEQDAIAQTLLGKSFRDLKPLLQAGRAAWDQYVAEGRDVAVVSAENVQALGDLDDAQNKLTASLDKSKYEVLAELAPLFTQVSEAMATAVQGFNDFLQTEEGQAAMQGLADALSGIITSLTGEGGESFQTLIEGAKGALDGLTQAFNWITEHQEGVVTAIKAIALALVGLKTASIGIKVAELAGNLKHLLGGFGGGAGGAAAGAGGGAGAAASAGGGAVRHGLLRGLMGKAGDGLFALADAAPFLGPVAGVAAGAAIFNAADQAYTQREFGEYNAMKDQIGEVVASAGDSVYGTILSEIKAALDTYEEDLTYEDVVNVFKQYSDEIAQVMGEGFDLDTALDEYSGIKWIEAGADLATALANGIEQGTLPTETAASTMGANVASAVADGITENIFRVQSAMASLTAAATVRGTLPGFAGAAGRTGQTGATLNATIVMDRTRVGKLVTPVVDGAIGSTIRGRLG